MTTNRFFDNPFWFLMRFGRNKAQIFIFLHIQAMKMKLPLKPYLAALIAATQVLYDLLFAKTSDKSSKTGQRIAETKEVNAAIENFKVAARKVYARAIDKVGKGSVIFNELFVNGMSDINHVILEDAYLVITTLRDGVTKYSIQLGVDMVTLMEDCYLEFDRVRLLQTGLASSVKSNSPLYNKVMDQMIGQLDTNRHTICLDDNTHPEENYFYFEESVLFTPSRHKGKDEILPTIVGVDPDTQKDSGISFGMGQIVTLMNPSDERAYYYAAQTADEPMPLSCLFLEKDEKVDLTPVNMGCPENKYFIIGNRSSDKFLVVKIWVK